MSDSPHDAFDFSDELTSLIERAYNNGTPVEGAWKSRISG